MNPVSPQRMLTPQQLHHHLNAIKLRLDALPQHHADPEALPPLRRAGLEKIAQELGLASSATHVQFNVFDVLDCKWRESGHSNIIAWLLDPNQSHGLGVAFLDGMLRICPRHRFFPSKHVRVYREVPRGELRFDIVVEASDWRVVIENKILASEHDSQSVDYAAYWRSKWRGRKPTCLLFLSPEGAYCQSPQFTCISYGTIAAILETILAGTKDRELKMLLEQVIEHIMGDFARVRL